jgi:acetyltransferase-like isoleucine patch superfamily enzyme
MWYFIGRVIRKIQNVYWNNMFMEYTNNKGKNINIIGPITIINKNVKYGKKVTLYPCVMLFGDGPIEIGDNVNIGNGTIIYASQGGGVKIGNNTLIAAQCYIIDTDHGMKSGELIMKQKNTISKVIIGSDVWISAGCKVLKGSNIHDGAVIGAMSLVKSEIEANAIAVGIPAKVIKYRK